MLRQGIQTGFPVSAIERSGCYFLSLCQWACLINGEPFTDGQIRAFYDMFVSRGLMTPECFISNPAGVLNGMLTAGPQFRNVAKSDVPPEHGRYIARMTNGSHTHFVLVDGLKRWDSLDPDRPSAASYRDENYRIFS